MRTCCFTGVAAIALALGVTAGAQAAGVQAAGVQNVESQRDTARGAQNQQGAQQQNAPAPSAQSRQKVQAPQGGDKQEAAGNEQPDRSGLIALDEREQTRIGNIVRQQRIQAVTNVNFSLSVASTVPSSVRLSRISGELADIFPHYRDFSFFLAKQQLVIVDPQSYGIVAFVPISGGGTSGTVGMAAPREDTGAASTAAPLPPAKKKAARTEKKSVTVTADEPRITERETIRRRPSRTETDVTVRTSRRDIDPYDEPAPRYRPIGPPVRERLEHAEGPPFPFSLFFGGPH